MPRKLPTPDDGVPSERPSGDQLKIIEGVINYRNTSPKFSGEKEDDYFGNEAPNRPKDIAYQTGQQKAY